MSEYQKNIIRHITHLKSNVVENDSPVLPEAADVEYGEISINYADGHETIAIKNDNDEIVTFPNKDMLDEVERVTASALNDLDERVIGINTRTGQLENDLSVIDEVSANAFNDINSRLLDEVSERQREDQLIRNEITGLDVPTIRDDFGLAETSTGEWYVSTDNTTMKITNGKLRCDLKVHKLTSNELTALGDSNVKEAYELIYATQVDKTPIGDVIKIYKDSSLKEVYIGSEFDVVSSTGEATKYAYQGKINHNSKITAEEYEELSDNDKALYEELDLQNMNFVHELSDGTFSIVHVDISKFLAENEFGRGLSVYDGKVSVKISTTGLYFDAQQALAIDTGDGLDVDQSGIYVKPNTQNGIRVDSNGVGLALSPFGGLTADQTGVYVMTGEGVKLSIPDGVSLKPASTTEIGGVAVHEVHTTLLGYQYNQIVGYSDGETDITIEDYNALEDYQKEDYYELREWTTISVAEYEELDDSEKNPAFIRPITDELTFNDGDGNFGVKLNDTDNKAYVNIPTAGGVQNKYGLVKVVSVKGSDDKYHGQTGIKIDDTLESIAVDYDPKTLELTSGDRQLSIASSILKQINPYYDAILYFEVDTFDPSTGDITIHDNNAEIIYNPNEYTVDQLISGMVSGMNISIKTIVSFNNVGTDFSADFPRLWEGILICGTTGGTGSYNIYNPIFTLFSKGNPYLYMAGVSSQSKSVMPFSNISLHDYSSWIQYNNQP